MGTPRARKSTRKAPMKSTSAVKGSSPARKRPHRPDSVLHPVAEQGISLPVRPDIRKPVRPISVRSRVTIGEKTL